jgi:dihydrofolate synthase/folylpolyglutamate synthase
MRFNNLNDWLNWQESLNPAEIDLGLDRIAEVLARAGLFSSFNCPLITVAGTNGKGSVVAMLEAMAMSAGLKVCSYTSPHLFQYNERIKINAQSVDDDVLCAAFERIDQARGNCQLTYFEFGTLAAIDLFFKQQPDLVILEVGLGGRLDAVNIMDPDVSVLTSIAIDHVDWLGDNRELIGFEKAGIFRARKPVICGETEPPQSVIAEAERQQCEFLLAGRDFDVMAGDDRVLNSWKLKSCYGDIENLPVPNLTGEFQKFNAATAILALQLLQSKGLLTSGFNLADAAVSALSRIDLAGRFQKINNQPQVYVDVAHNPQAALALSSQLKLNESDESKTWAIVAMLSDKDIKGVIESVSAEIDHWCFAGLENTPRGLSAQALIENLPDVFIKATKQENQCKILSDTVLSAESVKQACELVLSKATKNDRIIIFGSFYTVAEAMQYFS